MANTIANTGSSLGALAMSPFFRFLLDEFRLQGTLLIISGLFLQLFVVCVILRPESFYVKTKKTNKETPELDERVSVKTHDYNTKDGVFTDNNNVEDGIVQTYIPQDKEKCEHNGKNYSGFITQNRKSEGNVETSKSETGDNSNLFVSMNSLVFVGSVRSFDLSSTREKIQKTNITCFRLLKNSITNLLDKKLFKNKLFILFNIISFLCAYGCGSTVLYIPPFAKDLGIDDSSTAILVTISAAVDIAGRTFLLFIADRKFIKRHQILSIASIITGTSAMFCSFYKDFSSLAFFSSVFGFFGGMFFCLFPVILVDFIGLEKMGNGLSFNLVIHGLSYSIMLPFLGTYIYSQTSLTFLSLEKFVISLIESYNLKLIIHSFCENCSKKIVTSHNF